MPGSRLEKKENKNQRVIENLLKTIFYNKIKYLNDRSHHGSGTTRNGILNEEKLKICIPNDKKKLILTNNEKYVRLQFQAKRIKCTYKSQNEHYM